MAKSRKYRRGVFIILKVRLFFTYFLLLNLLKINAESVVAKDIYPFNPQTSKKNFTTSGAVMRPTPNMRYIMPILRPGRSGSILIPKK